MYKRINKLGLKVAECKLQLQDGAFSYAPDYYVRADDIEALLKKGVEVKSWGKKKEWSASDQPEQTVSGLVINIKPIEKPNPVNKAEIIKAIKAFVKSIQSTKYKCSLDEEIAVSKDLISRIEQSGVSDE